MNFIHHEVVSDSTPSLLEQNPATRSLFLQWTWCSRKVVFVLVLEISMWRWRLRAKGAKSETRVEFKLSELKYCVKIWIKANTDKFIHSIQPENKSFTIWFRTFQIWLHISLFCKSVSTSDIHFGFRTFIIRTKSRRQGISFCNELYAARKLCWSLR